MSIRFLIGRAGCGKTHHCIESIRARLAEDPLDGPKLILLVPEQAGLQMERALVAAGGNSRAGEGDEAGGSEGNSSDGYEVTVSHRAEVLSFRRLAFKVLESSGQSRLQALSDQARIMVLRHLVAQHRKNLRYYRRARATGGLYDRLAHSVNEFIEEGVEPADLDLAASAVEQSDPSRGAKLHDLSRIYCAYLNYLGSEWVDPSQYLQIARELLPQCGWLKGAQLWVDGFASLSGQEVVTLVSLAKLCHRVEISLLLDPRLIDSQVNHTLHQSSDVLKHSDKTGTHKGTYNLMSAQAKACGSLSLESLILGSLFERTRKTYFELVRVFQEAGLSVEAPKRFESDRLPRFRKSGRLARLERAFAQDDIVGEEAVEREKQADRNEGVIRVAALPSRRREVEHAIACVRSWLCDVNKPYRCRDIAVITRDLESYHDLLSEGLESAGIPFFIDRRRLTPHHPLVELVRGLVRAAAKSMSVEVVRPLLKTGLLPVSEEEADVLENYLLAHGISGVDRWSESEWTFQHRRSFNESAEPLSLYEAKMIKQINDSKGRIYGVLRPWLTLTRSNEGHSNEARLGETRLGREWATGLMELLETLDVEARLNAWAKEAQEDGDLNLAQEHRQVGAGIVTFVQDLAMAFENQKFDVRELGEIVDAGLAHLTIGLAPPAVDQVLVGSIDRSRHPELKAVVILGFNEGLFPYRHSEDSILNDDDRLAVTDQGVSLRPPVQEQLNDEKMLAYVALTRASEQLVITYATADEKGRALQPSEYLEKVRRIIPEMSVPLPLSREVEQARSALRRCPASQDSAAQSPHGHASRPAPIGQEHVPERFCLASTIGAGCHSTKSPVDKPPVAPDQATCPPNQSPECNDGVIQSRDRGGVEFNTGERSLDTILLSSDLVRRLVHEFRVRPSRSIDDPALRSQWNALYERVRLSLQDDVIARYAFSSLGEGREARLSASVVERLVQSPLRVSVSELETYAACPFQHFARYGLRLQERRVAELEPVDVGQVHHAILEDFINEIVREGQSLGTLNEMELDDRLSQSTVRVADRIPQVGELSAARDAYVLSRSRDRLGRILSAQRRLSARGRSRPRRAEVAFGFDQQGGLPALELWTPGGRRVLLRGYIDRVDLAELGDELLGIVIDYKQTRNKRLSLSEVYYGLSLQLLGYLIVLAEQGQSLAGRPIRPMAALYVSLSPQYEQVDHPRALSEQTMKFSPSLRPRGIVATDGLSALEAADDASGWSPYYAIYVKKDGSLGYLDRSDSANSKSLSALMERTRHQMGQLADSILDGEAAVRPYRLGSFSPCSWCPMNSVCQFEAGTGQARFYEQLKRSEVFRKLETGKLETKD